MPRIRSRVLAVGTRGSALARRQTQEVLDLLARHAPGVRAELRVIATAGDVHPERPLPSFGGRGVFVKEVEAALRSGEVDVAVHSLKDLPTEAPLDLTIAAVLPRADPRDALICRTAGSLRELPNGAVLGTGSPRRVAQLRHHRPDLRFTDLRGNVDTRLKKLEVLGLDGIVLAVAGLQRLGLQDRITERLPGEICLPAAGQGALAVQVRRDDPIAHELLRALDHVPTRAAVEAERTLLQLLQGGCHVPVAVLAQPDGARLHLQAVVAAPDGSQAVRGATWGPMRAASEVGRTLARDLLEKGAGDLLAAWPPPEERS